MKNSVKKVAESSRNVNLIYDKTYDKYAQMVYGLALKISPDPLSAHIILKELFLCLELKGLFTKENHINTQCMLSVTFECINRISSQTLPVLPQVAKDIHSDTKNAIANLFLNKTKIIKNDTDILEP